MIFEFVNKNENITLPKEPLLSKISTASEVELKVLLWAAAVSSEKDAFDENDIHELSGLDLTEIIIALQFWRGAEILASAGSAASTPNTIPKKQKLKIEHDIPIYSGEEVAAIIQNNPEINLLIDECQKATGKSMFNMLERNKIIALYDYLGLSSEYILSVFAYCAKSSNYGSKATVPYVVKTIYNIYDKGIDTDEKLRDYLKFREEFDSIEGNIRRIFGITNRALTKKERDTIERWSKDLAMSLDMIEYAYELTVNATNKPSLPYANKIMEKWHEAGYTTLEQAKNAEFDYKKKKEEESSGQSSFDNDEFFEAALKRSYDNIGKKPE